MTTQFSVSDMEWNTVYLPAWLCSQDYVDGVNSNSHNIDNCLSSLSVCQAVDAQRLQGGGAAVRKKRINQL